MSKKKEDQIRRLLNELIKNVDVEKIPTEDLREVLIALFHIDIIIGGYRTGEIEDLSIIPLNVEGLKTFSGEFPETPYSKLLKKYDSRAVLKASIIGMIKKLGNK